MNRNMGRMSSYGDDAADRAQSYADDVKSTAADLRNRMSDAIGKGAEWASRKTGDLDAASRELVGSVSETVSTRPMLAIGVALLAGFLISQLFSSRD